MCQTIIYFIFQHARGMVLVVFQCASIVFQYGSIWAYVTYTMRIFCVVRFFNPFKPEFTIVIFIHYKPRIAVAILDL